LAPLTSGFSRSDLRYALVIVLFVAVACRRDINIDKRKMARNSTRQTTVMLRVTTFRSPTDHILYGGPIRLL
jgi:hypothetical protein